MNHSRPPASLLVVPAYQTAELDRVAEDIGVPAERLVRVAIDAWLTVHDPGYVNRQPPSTLARVISFPNNGNMWHPDMS